ncbi:hypothetical protein TGAM01_v209197 [Trichoderma gamsii]|uniref:Uncharacterized protein n=1 Tax=Trichoderma gamsii TaxID=398673 RepID=A0A2P4ZCG7_9HYPO|nr:hypothetical protein TGAM01_v209197 [Trichoderma gamsii]PON21941.1 hypothetical protein TGAM01_v209197 [Trichoderma gamsii]
MESLQAALNITYKYSAHEFLFLHRIPAQCIVTDKSLDIQLSGPSTSQEGTGYTTTLESGRQDAFTSAHNNLIQSFDALSDSLQQFIDASTKANGVLTRIVNKRAIGDAASEEAKEIKEDQENR